MTRGASAGPFCLRGIIVFGMDTDGPRAGKLLVLAVTGEAERIIIVCLDQLGPAGPSMGVVTIEAENPSIEMTAFLKIKPLLMLRFGMGLRISPDTGLKLVIIG